ncbi:hypothetical protein BH24ACT15_BH24ACT15_07090 [soil metagenome]
MCRHCDAGLLPGARFCVNCGTSTAPVAEAAPPESRSVLKARLVECDDCGAGNAASRPLCARCGAPLRDEIPGGDALPDSAHDHGGLQAATSGSSAARDVPTVLLSLVILAGLVTAGVLLSLLSSRVGASESPTVPTGVSLQAASASTALDGHPASHAIDGDPATSWTEAAQGPGQEEWLEVTMAADVSVQRVLIWDGDQRSDRQFRENGRAKAVRIEVADRQFRVRLQDLKGPQAIDLPEPVVADRVRVVVEDAIAGSRYTDLAISEIVVEASP